MERSDLELWKAKEVARLLALVETERRYYQDMIASLPVGLLVLSADLSIVSFNNAIRQIFGLRGGESVRGRLSELLPKHVVELVQEVLASGSPRTGVLADTKLKGGRRLRLGIQAMHNWSDETEQEALLTIEDVTEFMPAAPASGERAPHQAGGALTAEQLMENLEATIWAVEVPAMKFVFVNEYGQRLLGFETKRWLESADFWRQRIHPDDRASVVAYYETAIENRDQSRSVTAEYRSIAKDGREIWIYEAARIVEDSEGRARYIVGASLDVTERRRLEGQAVRANRVDAVGKLAGRMAHDLNNILMIVSGYAEEVLHGLPAGSPLRTDVREILQAADRITVLTNQMLAFTRYQTEPSEAVELNAALERMERGLRDGLGPKIALELVPSPEPLVVSVEAAQLQQVLNAFVRHAREAMPGDGKLTIVLTKTAVSARFGWLDGAPRPRDWAVLTVRDTGRQHDAESLAVMFESFLPAKESTEEAGPALARAYALVRQWGGDISVANGPAGGSVFEVLLPLVLREARRPIEGGALPAAAGSRAETILVVEDEAGIRALISKILRRQGYEVLEAEDATHAQEICHEHGLRIDLLITDVVMPEMGGRELAHQLRVKRRDLKVLYVSGYTDDASVYVEPLPPGTAYLQKPFTLGSLQEKVKEVLAGKTRP